MFGRYSGTGGRNDPPPGQNPSRQQPPPQNYGRPDERQPYGQAPQRAPVGRPQPEQTISSRGRAPVMQLKVAKTPGNEWALANNAAFSPQDFPGQQELYLMLNGQFVVTARSSPQIQPGTLGLSDFQRRWASIGLGPSSVIEVTQYDPFSQGSQGYLGGMDVELAFQSKNKRTDKPYDQEELQHIVIANFGSQILAPGQIIVFDVKGFLLLATVKSVQLVNLSEKPTDTPSTDDPRARGILQPQTQITFTKDPASGLNLKASVHRVGGNSILAPNFKFSELGIGGLDDEFQQIFRKAFASRLFPPGIVEKMNIMHVKGMLLYGPPGTGKTLIARQIGKSLNAREPKIINGPEVLNKFVGQSEENIRKLFADAEKEYKEKGAESMLHIIIFDELDAVCKQRGSGSGGGTGVGDSVVNQLLSKLDGVEKLDNILLIGMTNRKDMIDEALLRAGRLEVHIEIGLPDEAGRVQILNIHTASMQQNNILDRSVDLKAIARETKNYSGAEISGLVRAASSFAFGRHIEVGNMARVKQDANEIKVTMDDFENALAEMKPLFGVAEDELADCQQGGICEFSPAINEILETARRYVAAVRSGARLRSTILAGPRGSGKTALAAQIALDSQFPYIKLVSPNDMVGLGEQGKIAKLEKIFTDADKSPQSIVVIDNIEGILEWVPIGPRFQATVLAALRTLITRPPPNGKARLVIGTTSSRSTLQQLEIFEDFQREIPVPNVNTAEELGSILNQRTNFHVQDIRKILLDLQERTGKETIGVGIKDVLLAIEQAGDDSEAFSEDLSTAIAQRAY